MNKPMRISIDDVEFINTTPSSSNSSNVSSYFSSPTYTISPLTHISSPIPNATGVSDTIVNARPFNIHQFFYDFEDEHSLPTYSTNSISTNTHSTNSFYNKVKYNYANIIINIVNMSTYFGYVLFFNGNVNDINPYDYNFFYYATIPYPNCVDSRHQVWRLFSYSLVHSGLAHLLGNSFGIIISTFGIYKFQKSYKIITLYTAAVINGALFFYLNKPSNIAIGASGGVYGIAGSNLSNLIYNYKKMNPLELLWAYSYNSLFILSDLISFFYLYKDNVAYEIHWAMYLYGLFFGLAIYK